MIGESLTKPNLQAILKAMSQIKEIDRSQFFYQYLREVVERLEELEKQQK